MADHTVRSSVLWVVGWSVGILAVAAFIYYAASVGPKNWDRYKAKIEERQCFFEELAQPRIYKDPGIHEAPTYHLQAHHDQILIQLRRIEEKVDRIIEKGADNVEEKTEDK